MKAEEMLLHSTVPDLMLFGTAEYFLLNSIERAE